MYPEIKGRLRKIDGILEEHFHVDKRVEGVLKELRNGLEFLAKRVWELEHPPAAPDPHRHLPGADD